MKRTAQITLLALLCTLPFAATGFAQNSLSVTDVRPIEPGIIGTYSLKIDYDPTSVNNTYVQSNDPTDETVHRINVLTYLDTTGGNDWADNDKHQVIKVRQIDPSPATVWRVHVRKISQVDPTSKYRMVLWCNGGGDLAANQEFVAEFYLIPNAWQEFGFEWSADSGSGDGECTMWKAGNYGSRRGLTNMTGTDSFNIDTQLLGAFDYVVHGDTRGSAYWDNFESFRTFGQ